MRKNPRTLDMERRCARILKKLSNDYQMMIDKIKQLREIVWLEDIPHPTIPEYVELHEKIQRILRFIDDELLKGEEE